MDRFRLMGPEGGAPIAFEARLALNGGLSGTSVGGIAFAEIAEPGGAFVSVDESFLPPLLSIPLSHAVGEEFLIELTARACSLRRTLAEVDGHLSFAGLPAGYGVTSCQGFAGGGAVASLPVTWGSLKFHYR
jgi:hypothetical protein